MLKRLLLLLVGVLFLLGWGGCSDNPEDTGTPEDTTSDSVAQYYVYALDQSISYCEFLVLQTLAATPLVTRELTTQYDAIYLAPNGRILLSSSAVDSTAILPVDTATSPAVIPGSGKYFFDPTGAYYLKVTASRVYRLSPLTLQPIDSIVASLGQTAVDTTNHLLYGTDRTGLLPGVVYRYDYVARTRLDSLVLADSLGQPIEIGTLLPVPEHSRLYFLGRRTNNELRAYVYNLSAHSIVSSSVVESAQGQFVATHSGNRIYQSDPSLSGGECRIWYRDVTSNALLGHMSTTVTLDGGGTVNVQINDMCITPDDRYLYATGRQSGLLLVFDLSTHKLVSATSPFFLQLAPRIVLGDEVP